MIIVHDIPVDLFAVCVSSNFLSFVVNQPHICKRLFVKISTCYQCLIELIESFVGLYQT